MNNKLSSDFKKEYLDLEVPSEISNAIKLGIERGQNQMNHKNNFKNKVLKICASLILATAVLTGAVNYSPSFAESLMKLPIIGEIVKVLQFSDGKANGGTITDGSDISEIEIIEEATYEDIVIEFSNESDNQESSGAFKVSYSDYPSTMTFEIGGARRFSALNHLDKIEESKYVKAVYPLMTMDDSLVRFVIEFSSPVEYEVVEVKSPPSIIIRVSEKVVDSKAVTHIVRTTSYPKGETLGIKEEELSKQFDTRVLKDQEGQFLIEIKTFESFEAAEAFVEEISATVNELFIIESRKSNDVPSHYPNDVK